MLWKVEEAAFSGWGSDGWVPTDFDPILRIDASPKMIGQVIFHPTASNVLASASGEHTVKLWDLANPENAKVTLGGHADTIQSFAFNFTGTLLVTICRDRKLRLFDPRSGGDAIRAVDGHGGINGARVVWMGDFDRFATTGFSKMSDRQVGAHFLLFLPSFYFSFLFSTSVLSPIYLSTIFTHLFIAHTWAHTFQYILLYALSVCSCVHILLHFISRKRPLYVFLLLFYFFLHSFLQ